MKRLTILLSVIVLLAGVSTIALAASITGTTTGTVLFESPDGPDVLTEDVDVNASVPIQSDLVDLGYVEITGDSSSETKITTSGSSIQASEIEPGSDGLTLDRDGTRTAVRIDSISTGGSVTLLEDIDLSSDNGELAVTGSATLTLTGFDAGEAVEFSEPIGETRVASVDGTIQITLTDATIAVEGGETFVTVQPDPFDGSVVRDATAVNETVADVTHSVEVTNNLNSGRIKIFNQTGGGSETEVLNQSFSSDEVERSVTWPVSNGNETQQWRVEVIDSFGDMQHNETYSYDLPWLNVYDYADGSRLTGDNYVVEFDGLRTQNIETVPTVDGQAVLTELDSDVSAFSVRGSELQNFSDSQTLAALLPENDANVELYFVAESVDTTAVTFSLSDRTGDFDTDTTGARISTQRGDSYDRISGDVFGGADRFTIDVATGDRFRIDLIDFSSGERRSIGPYVPTGQTDLVEINVGEISLTPGGTDEQPAALDAAVEDGQIQFTVSYDDELTPQATTVQIHERGNETNTILDRTYSADRDLTGSVGVPENSSVAAWTVNVTVDGVVDGEQVSVGLEQQVGQLGSVDLPVGGQLLQVLSLGGVLLMAGLFGGRLSHIGSLVVVVFAALLTFIGWLSVPPAFLLAAATIAILFRLGSSDPTPAGAP